MESIKFKLFSFVCILPHIFAQNLTTPEPTNSTQTEELDELQWKLITSPVKNITLKELNYLNESFNLQLDLLNNQTHFAILRHGISIIEQLSSVSCYHYAYGLTSLMNQVEKLEGETPFPEILSFPEELPSECANNTDAVRVHNQIQNLTSGLIKNWTEKIVKGNFKSILEYVDQTYEVQHDVQKILPELISLSGSYNKPLHLYGFIDNMILPQDKFISYKKLFEMFGNANYSEHMMELAYGFYKLSLDPEFNENKEFADDYNAILNKLPLQDKQLFWNSGSCKVVNAGTNESLVPFQNINKNGHQYVYTSLAPEEKSEIFPWKLIVKRNHKGVLFRIESKDKTSELCYSHSSKRKRRVGICKENSEIDSDYENTWWRIEPDIFGTGSYYILYGNRCRDNYLYASEKFYELGKRKIKVGKQYYASLWDIACQ